MVVLVSRMSIILLFAKVVDFSSLDGGSSHAHKNISVLISIIEPFHQKVSLPNRILVTFIVKKNITVH